MYIHEYVHFSHCVIAKAELAFSENFLLFKMHEANVCIYPLKTTLIGQRNIENVICVYSDG